MKKNAIIELIEGDLRDMLTLVDSFRDVERIGKDFIALLAEKNESIGREVNLLNYWASEGIQTPARTVELVADIKAKPASAPKVQPSEPASAAKPFEQPQATHSENGCETQEIAPLILEESDDDLFEFEKPKAQNDAEQLPEFNLEFVQPNETASQAPKVTEPQTVQTAPAERVASAPAPAQKKTPEPTSAPEPAKPSPTPAPQAFTQLRRSAADIANYGTPVSDINRALSFNDRFLFRRELFGGDMANMDQVLIAINAASTYEEAHNMLRANFHWDESDPTVELFLKAVHRRFL